MIKRDWTVCLELLVVLNLIVNIIGGRGDFLCDLRILL